MSAANVSQNGAPGARPSRPSRPSRPLGAVGLVLTAVGQPGAAALRSALQAEAGHDVTVLTEALGGVGDVPRPADERDPIDLFEAAHRLQQRGVDAVLLPVDTVTAVLKTMSAELSVPLFIGAPDDANIAKTLTGPLVSPPRHFKVGVVGGVGPAATVDFLDKFVRATPASIDQEHIRVVVEQNPQIPDRTAHLLGHSDIDPAIALYAACSALVAANASLIAIPCNTAHAYVERLQPRLPIPIINLLDETIDYIVTEHGADAKVGLLATAGTIASGVYRDAAARRGMRLMLPDDAHQALVTETIYGNCGVKAGFLTGECVENLMAAVAHLASSGATVLILGCTELPLLLEHTRRFPIDTGYVALVDPTRILAERCVTLALEAQKGGHTRSGLSIYAKDPQ